MSSSFLGVSPQNLPPHDATNVSQSPLLWTPSEYNFFELSGTGVKINLQESTIVIGDSSYTLDNSIIHIDQPVYWLQWWQSDCVIGGTDCLYLGMTGVKITNWRGFILVNYLGDSLGSIYNVFGLTPPEYLSSAGMQTDKVQSTTCYTWS
jgi:hypothetical protein